MLRRWLRLSLGLLAWRLDTGFGNKYRMGRWDEITGPLDADRPEKVRIDSRWTAAGLNGRIATLASSASRVITLRCGIAHEQLGRGVLRAASGLPVPPSRQPDSAVPDNSTAVGSN